MKKTLLITALVLLAGAASAQEEKEKKDDNGGFKKNNIFIGGGINVGAGTGSFAIGIIPEVGYSITKWLDGGISFNLNYVSQNGVYDNSGFGPYRIRNFNYGGGPFIRIWPFNFLNISVQPEYNWITSRQEFQPTGQKGTFNFKAESLLIGIGYGSRDVGSQLSYFNIMVDVLKNINSPYRDEANRGRPILRTGFGFYLGRR
jgi:hypothetical protein